MKRVFVTPNIQPTEEALDMSCFLSAADKGEDDEEEVPELVDGDEMEEEEEMDEEEEGEDDEEGDEDEMDEDDDEALLA